ncbi:hypothetical protein PhCBS80983_g05354 [Powellomyces hirtus]|uniref:Ubiquilin n=1 Tax=Powellomyces hirtus TaxID=109895 RepID=A0A507DVS5_9FUNG|nr:hypothetical protein PhCBS80983_g05354 [Powellomyces hirtus]
MSSSDSASPLTITFRLTPGLEGKPSTKKTSAGDVPVHVANPSSATVFELKTQLAEKLVNIEPDQLRLVYAGRIFKDDEAIVASLSLQDGNVVHATKLASNKAAEEAVAAGATVNPLPGQGGLGASSRNVFGLPDMSEMLENPMVRSMLENPEFMRTMLENDPRIARLAESNPQLRQTLNDPTFLREMLATMRNPALSQEMMRNVDRQLLNIENIPGGFNALSSMYHDIQAPLNQVRDENPSTDEANRRFAEMFGAQRRSSDEGINNDALPNPWAAPPPPQPTTPSRQQTIPTGMPPHFNMFGNPTGAQNPFSFMMPPVNNDAFSTPQFPSFPQSPSQQQQPPFDLNTIMQQIQQMQGLFAQPPPMSATPITTTRPLPTSAAATTTSTSPAAATAAPTPITNTAQHEERFAQQLSALADMGFEEKDRCIRALLAAGGNVEAAIAYMLDSP